MFNLKKLSELVMAANPEKFAGKGKASLNFEDVLLALNKKSDNNWWFSIGSSDREKELKFCIFRKKGSEVECPKESWHLGRPLSSQPPKTIALLLRVLKE